MGRGRAASLSATGRRVKGKMPLGMEDSHIAEFHRLEDGNEVGLFVVFNGLSDADVATYLGEHLSTLLLREQGFGTDTMDAIRRAYHRTDWKVLRTTTEEGDSEERSGRHSGSTVARGPRAAPGARRERRGGFVTEMHGDMPRVDAQLAMSRAFGDR